MIINILEIQQKQSSTRDEILHLLKHLSSEKKILLADKCDNHVLHRVASQIWRLQLQAWYGLVGKANGRARTLRVFPFRRRRQKSCARCFTIRSGKVATVLRPLKSVVRKYISPRINFIPGRNCNSSLQFLFTCFCTFAGFGLCRVGLSRSYLPPEVNWPPGASYSEQFTSK